MSQVRHDLREAAVAKEDASAARTLAAGAHEDVADVRNRLIAHTGTLNALRETQVEHGELLIKHGELLVKHGQRLDTLEAKVDEGFARTEKEFATLKAGMTQITALLTTIIERDQAQD